MHASAGWYVQYSGRVTGPHDASVLRKGVADGHLAAASLVAETPLGPFVHLETKPEFANLFRPRTTEAGLQHLAESENVSALGRLALQSTVMRGLQLVACGLVVYGKLGRSLLAVVLGVGLWLLATIVRRVLRARAGVA